MVAKRVKLGTRNRFTINLRRIAIEFGSDDAVIRDPRVTKQADGRFRVKGSDKRGSFFFLNVRLIYRNIRAGRAEQQSDSTPDATYTFKDENCKRHGFAVYSHLERFRWSETIEDMEEDEPPFFGFIVRNKLFAVDC